MDRQHYQINTIWDIATQLNAGKLLRLMGARDYYIVEPTGEYDRTGHPIPSSKTIASVNPAAVNAIQPFLDEIYSGEFHAPTNGINIDPDEIPSRWQDEAGILHEIPGYVIELAIDTQ